MIFLLVPNVLVGNAYSNTNNKYDYAFSREIANGREEGNGKLYIIGVYLMKMKDKKPIVAKNAPVQKGKI
ncbi:MAG: hypothetical protein PHU67_05245 [Sulfurovum sp.]|nr:hypothetical protein [Sulfurovum sp.]